MSGSTTWPVAARSQSAKRTLAARLARRKASRNEASSARGRSFSSSDRSTTQSSPIDVGDEPREVGVRQQEPAPRRHAVGLVVEAAGELLGQVAQHGRPEQSRVERGDAVGAVRPDDRQVGHPDPLLRLLLDQADAADAVLVAGVARAHVVEEAAVHLVDDLEVPGQADLEEGDRPGLQGLGQQRVIGVGERPDGQVPRLVPAEPGLVQQDAHQLGDGQRRVGVVELDRDLVGQRVPVVAPAAEPRHDIGQRAGDQEILLDEPQALAAGRRVVGIEDPRERLGGDLLVDGVEEVAAAELAEVEVLVRRRAPEPERVDRPAAVADDRPVVGQAHEGRRHVPDDLEPPVLQLEIAIRARPPRPRSGGRPPRGRDGGASGRGARPGGRRRSPGGRSRTRTAGRSRSRGSGAWPSSRGSRRRAGPARRCPGRRRARSRRAPPSRGPRAPRTPSATGSARRLRTLFVSDRPIRNSSER